MKKVMNKISFALVGVMASAPAFADGLCDLLVELKKVFSVLRTAAFIGAAFYIAGWAWGYISSGKAEMKDVKEKGIGLLVGFALLFMVGVILSFLLSSTGQHSLGCPDITKPW
jgi:hypothetical protein